MKAEITIIGTNICCRIIESDREYKIAFSQDTRDKLLVWQNSYSRAINTGQNEKLPAIGKAMFDWLNQSHWAAEWANGQGDREVIIRVNTTNFAEARLLLDAPWELLFNENNFLAADKTQDYIINRKIASSTDSPQPPAYSDLAVAFMAAAPEGHKELDFEAEEAAILMATQNLPLSLCVEESGCHRYLKDKLTLEGPFEAVHLSCHGNISSTLGPVLLLEDPEGKPDITLPINIKDALGETKASLVFLSACRTAEANREEIERKDGDPQPAASDSFAQLLVSAGVANVVGWDGSVYDLDATSFASFFYDELARYSTIPYAVAKARRQSLLAHLNNPQKGRHWHLARLYTGNHGGGQLCQRGKDKRQLTVATRKEFLDRAEKRVPVATALEFVGRRRQAQKIMRLFREDTHAGVFVHGMGNIGKSSLAARLAGRMPRLKPVVIYKDYDAQSIFERLVQAVPAAERRSVRQDWKQTVDEDPASLLEALETLLSSVFQTAPIFLIIDDLEQILEEPTQGNTGIHIKDAPGNPDDWRIAITAVIKAFEAYGPVDSKLLFTSRYQFILPDKQNNDMAGLLAAVQLPPMSTRERVKQWKAAKLISGSASKTTVEPETEIKLLAKIIDSAGGNPGLQQILCHPLLSGEAQVAQTALDQILKWKKTGEIPIDESKAQDFLIRISIETYQNALTDTQQSLLRVSAFFAENVPIPKTALLATGSACGIDDVIPALSRLVALGLVDQLGNIDDISHMAANPLARPLVAAPFAADENKMLADNSFDALCQAWQRRDGTFSPDPRAVELSRIALMTNVPLEHLENAVIAAAQFLFNTKNKAQKAFSFLKSAVVKMDDAGHQLQPKFIILGANCAERIGERDFQLDLLKRGETLKTEDIVGRAQIMSLYAEATIADQGPEKALQTLNTTSELFKNEGDEKSCAVTMGKIADILQQKGDTDEALRIRKEEELPVYDRLGDVRSRAVTMGQIADILQQKGDTDEALRIHMDERLPTAIK
ncbi:MAG: CHAT domain-containing protein, partial [Desulfobacterales bacterium]|nr:CHAT domain-containing protein [Desulfobacterales bacterium]